MIPCLRAFLRLASACPFGRMIQGVFLFLVERNEKYEIEVSVSNLWNTHYDMKVYVGNVSLSKTEKTFWDGQQSKSKKNKTD